MRHRNAYAILGIPFGATRQEANVAFIRRARPLRRRRDPESRDRLTDLTWALNQIDEAIRKPEAALEIYRIPADPDAFELGGSGVFAPPPETLPAAGGDAGDALRRLREAAAHEYLRHLMAARAAHAEFPEP